MSERAMAIARCDFPMPIPPTALIGDEGAAGEIADQGFVDRRVGEVEVVDVLGQRQLGDGELVFDGAGLLLRYLGLQEITDNPGRLVLVLALLAELRLLRTQDLAHHFARDLQLAADRLDRLPLDQRQPTYLCNRLQNQHPKHKGLRSNRRHLDDPIVKGSRLDENRPLNRVLIPRKITNGGRD